VPERERAEGKRAERERRGRAPHDERARELFIAPALRELAERRLALVGGIDHERREPLARERAHRGKREAERHEQAPAHDQRERNAQQAERRAEDAREAPARERRVLGILGGAEQVRFVMLAVRAHVHEARREQRKAGDEAPTEREARDGAR
jgi:hypothetical protein